MRLYNFGRMRSFIALLPLKFCNSQLYTFTRGIDEHTLSAHRAEPLGGLLLDPGQEAVLLPEEKSVSIRSLQQ